MTAGKVANMFLGRLGFYAIFALILSVVYVNEEISTFTLLLILGGWSTLFVVLPFVVKNSPAVQRTLVFFNFANVFRNASDPQGNGLNGARNFYVQTDQDVQLGLWHILPSEEIGNDSIDDEYFDVSLERAQDVVLYCHGNGGNRATAHRVEMYGVLRERFHVITFDYRGYGDSSALSPSQSGVVNDTMFVIEWILGKIPRTANFFVWGHSLGASISLNAISNLKAKSIIPTGLVLESPFNNLRDEISEFPLAKIFKHLPWFHYSIVDPVINNGFIFQSDRYILNVDCSILILHAKDDRIIPFELGYKLYETARTYRVKPQGSVRIFEFDSKLKYGHKFICRAPELKEIIGNFTSSAIKERKLYEAAF